MLETGREYTIDRGSYKGQKRLEFDHVTIQIKYPCGSWLRLAGTFESVDSEGNSLYVITEPVGFPWGTEGYRLTIGDSLLFGLTLEDSHYRPGQGGFRASPELMTDIIEELAGCNILSSPK